MLPKVRLNHFPTFADGTKRVGYHCRSSKEVCGALADAAYPLRVPGNLAAGRTNGTAQHVRDYFSKCVADGGNMGGRSPKQRGYDDNGGPKEAR